MSIVVCKKDYVEDAILYWSKGKTYEGNQNEDGSWSIETNVGVWGKVGEAYLLDDFSEYFSTDEILINLAEAHIDFSCEIEMNCGWIYDHPDNDPIGETNFVVLEDWLRKYWQENIKNLDKEKFEDFLDWYDPDVDGKKIYEAAKESGAIIEDIGKVFYSDK